MGIWTFTKNVSLRTFSLLNTFLKPFFQLDEIKKDLNTTLRKLQKSK